LWRRAKESVGASNSEREGAVEAEGAEAGIKKDGRRGLPSGKWFLGNGVGIRRKTQERSRRAEIGRPRTDYGAEGRRLVWRRRKAARPRTARPPKRA
jgi:hypothetical protein